MRAIGPIPHDAGFAGSMTRLRLFFKRYGPQASIVLLCLIISVVMWASLLVQSHLERERIIESQFHENENLARIFEEHVRKTVRAAEITLMEIRSEYQRSGRKLDLAQYVKDRGIYLDPYNSLSVSDKNGDQILSSFPIRKPLNFRNSEDFQFHSLHDTQTLFISEPRLGKITGKWTVYLSLRINNADGSFAGGVSLGMDPSYFSKIYTALDLGKDSLVTLVRRDGVVLMRNTNAKVTAGERRDGSDLFARYLPTADQGSFVGAGRMDGIARILSYRALKDYPLVVLVGTSMAAALADYNQRVSRYVAGASGITLVILCLGLLILVQIERSKRAEDALHLLNTELEQRVRERTSELQSANRELETFTYSVSHDLKAPLRGIDGYSRLLLAACAAKLGNEGRGFLQNIIRATAQMTQLIEDLLAYSRLERRDLQIHQVNPLALIESLLAERANDIKARSVAVTLAVACPSVTADRDGLAMALRNLLENALKFTRNAPQPMIEIGGRDTGTTCILSVRDNGVGFDMKFHDRIFDIFQRLHRSEDYPGTGIGLAIVRKAMERMGGRAWAGSEPGKGATFYLEIPK